MKLTGRASASGTSAYNQRLSTERVDAAATEMSTAGFTGISTRLNLTSEGDTGTTEDPGWRRVDLEVDGGRGQFVGSHEFGHVFGLDDEYAIDPGGSILGTGNPAGTPVGHDQMAKDVGVTSGAVAENNAGIMSLGNSVKVEHYSTFGWALMELTGVTEWDVV